MRSDRKRYFIDFIPALGGFISFEIALLTFNAKANFYGITTAFLVLASLLIVAFLIQRFAPKSKLIDFSNGLWFGLIFYILIQLESLPWFIAPIDAIKGSLLFIVFAAIVFFVGMFLREKDNKLTK